MRKTVGSRGPSVVIALLVGFGLAGANAFRASAKDCGERPSGTNPSNEELLAAVEELSLEYQVPIEIILAVAYRESGIQQWRKNGKLVVNEKDCGLGMMQLTGSTAEMYDVPRLKADWRYNLECGVDVLQRKWRRAEREKWKRKGKKLPLPDRAVLENWYYALSYYQGRRTGAYPGKVFDHLRKRPGKLRALLPGPIEVSNPDTAIEGFSYGMGYTALRGNRIVLEDGRRLEIKTTIGTIGNPELTAKLDAVLARAERELERGRLGKALRWFRLIVEHGQNTRPGRRAQAALAQIGKEADAALAEADRLRDEGDFAGALQAYDEIEDRFEGLEAAKLAAARAEAIRNDPTLAARAEELEREARARKLYEIACRQLERSRVVEAARRFRSLVRRYADTEAGTKAQAQLAEIEADPALRAKLQAAERERKLRLAIARAESFLANDMFDQAIAEFEAALRLEPKGAWLERCRRGLERAKELREADE